MDIAPEIVESYLNAVPGDPFARTCKDEAQQLVNDLVKNDVVPAVIMNAAVTQVAADLWHRKGTRNGIAQFDSGELGTSTIRVRNDPIAAARPFLAPYIKGGFA